MLKIAIEFSLVIGTIGMILILIAFVLDELNKIMQNTVTYNVLNIAGASLLFYYAFSLKSIPFQILNIFWAAVALYKLITILKTMEKQ